MPLEKPELYDEIYDEYGVVIGNRILVRIMAGESVDAAIQGTCCSESNKSGAT